jgi:hypothetical protein
LDLPFETAGLSSDELKRFEETYLVLNNRFHIQQTGHIDFHLEDFEIVRQYLAINVRNSFVIRHTGNDCYMLFIDTQFKPVPNKVANTGHNEHQVWALAYLKHDFGRVMIRPETLADKLIELIHPIELDFKEDKAFSDTFYVLIDDHQKAVTGINRNFRNAVMDIRENDFVIEIVNHTLVISDRKPLSPEKALYMAEFVSRICENC